MRFALTAVALAGAVLAEEAKSTFYSTEYVTVTSCGPEVTNCPASSTVVSSTVIPLTTSTIFTTTTKTITDCPDTVTHCPADSTVVVTETVAVSTTVCPVTETETPEEPEETATVKPSGSGSPTTTLVTEAPACPTTSVKTIKTSITTVIPTIIYETVTIPCETGVPPQHPSAKPTGGNPAKPPSPVALPPSAALLSSPLLPAWSPSSLKFSRPFVIGQLSA
ncbi:hypothetical protein N0V88_002012 [Collariella sp. IMI 366227]|nr:hypothetical protein N0V88_002012 [Collariella sp. IMI 366227]